MDDSAGKRQIILFKTIFEDSNRRAVTHSVREGIPQSGRMHSEGRGVEAGSVGGDGQRGSNNGTTRLILGTREMESITEIRRSRWIVEDIVQGGEDVSIPAKTNREPLELRTKLGNVVVLAQSEDKTDAQILQALKLI